MNKLLEFVNSFISLFKRNKVAHTKSGAEEEYDAWLGI